MKQNFKLTKDQQTLVEKNLSIVHWVIVNNIHVNPGICGLEYGDLFQEGCLWLCKAAFTYNAGQAQFSTYAKKVVKNGLLSYCRKSVVRGGTSVADHRRTGRAGRRWRAGRPAG